VAIEKIRAGDLVMAADENGNRGLKRVVRTFARQTDSIVTVSADGEKIRCTPEHPFFKTRRYNWTLWASKRKQLFRYRNRICPDQFVFATKYKS